MQKQDDLFGECERKDREISLQREERNRLIARADDTRQLLGVMTESKEVATKLVKSHIVRADNFQKELESLNEELASKIRLERTVTELTIALEATQQKLNDAKYNQSMHSRRMSTHSI